MSRWLVALLVLVPLVAWADEPDPEPPASGAKQLDGEWELVGRKSKGVLRKVLPGRGMTMIIQKDKMTRKISIKGELREMVFTFKVDSRKSPAHIDMTTTRGSLTTYGIFKVTGNELTFCTERTKDGVSTRPRDFESARLVMVFKRKKK
jgi:uncharacterized protein (TIGR03067 family)